MTTNYIVDVLPGSPELPESLELSELPVLSEPLELPVLSEPLESRRLPAYQPPAREPTIHTFGCRKPGSTVGGWGGAFVYAMTATRAITAVFDNGSDYIGSGDYLLAIKQYNHFISEGWVPMTPDDICATAGIDVNASTLTDPNDYARSLYPIIRDNTASFCQKLLDLALVWTVPVICVVYASYYSGLF